MRFAGGRVGPLCAPPSLVKRGVNSYHEGEQRPWLQLGAASHSPTYTPIPIARVRVGEDFSLSSPMSGGAGSSVCGCVLVPVGPLPGCVQLCTCESTPARDEVPPAPESHGLASNLDFMHFDEPSWSNAFHSLSLFPPPPVYKGSISQISGVPRFQVMES